MTELELLKKKNEELEGRVDVLEEALEELIKVVKTSLEEQATMNNKVLNMVTNTLIKH